MRLKNFTLFIAILYTQIVYCNKHALIIAIGEYPSNTGWRKISSENDIEIIKAALIQRGFN